MDASQVTAALTTAKVVVSSHGAAAWITPRSAELLARPVDPATRCLRYDFALDPHGPPDSPACFLAVAYEGFGGTTVGCDGATVARHRLRVSLGSSTIAPMGLAEAERREALASHLILLGRLLEAVLPGEAAVVVETREERAARAAAAGDAALGAALLGVLPPGILVGLRRGGGGRSAVLPASWRTGSRGWPVPGDVVFRARHPRRGTAVYRLTVAHEDPAAAPVVHVRRVA